MTVTLKLYATLARFLPASALKNAIELSVEEGTSVRHVLDEHHVPVEMCHLVLVNGIYTSPRNSGSKILEEGDVVAVWPPVAGG